jgi:hypothetical protein
MPQGANSPVLGGSRQVQKPLNSQLALTHSTPPHNLPRVTTSSFSELIRWLAAHTAFPASRLPNEAELLLLFGLAAKTEENAENERHLIVTRNSAKDAALRAHNLRRNQVHYKCDNSAKV